MTPADQTAYRTIMLALSRLEPDERVMVMERVHDWFCPNCGYPAPPSDETCSICKGSAE